MDLVELSSFVKTWKQQRTGKCNFHIFKVTLDNGIFSVVQICGPCKLNSAALQLGVWPAAVMPRKGKGRPRGSRGKSRGSSWFNDTQSSEDARIREIVDSIEVADDRQELLDEEADITELVAETEEAAETSLKDPLPADPLPLFVIQSWKTPWRRAFFADWRWDGKKKEGESQVWTRCKTGKCPTKSKQHYYAGGSSSFTNFEKHLTSFHNKEYKSFAAKTQKHNNQPSIESYSNRSTSKQIQHK